LESEWRWGLAESGLDPDVYRLASRDLGDPTYIWVYRPDYPNYVFACYEDPLFPEELAYEVAAYEGFTFALLAQIGSIVPD